MGKKSSKKSRSSDAPVVGKDTSLRDLLRVPAGPVSVRELDASATPGFPGKGKADAPAQTEAMAPRLSDLQERLYARGRDDKQAPRVLVLLQGLDTAGKGGVIRHAMGLVDPQGVQLTAFKAPTAVERKHDFLWRIRRALPDAGMIGVFDRSHYEDVLVARVDKLVPAREWRKRYDLINDFEAELAESNVKLVKCFLNVSREEQQQRLLERLDNPEKYWKYNPGDVDTRREWDDYMLAYGDLLEKCNPDGAPWYVIPADRKWYRNWAVARMLLETLEDMELTWPAADFDVTKERQRVLES